ncbi:GNAT family N-acetyltransferase [Streptomyces tuirus]|uniref:GNAT family N-acetyltransferase n=1 Tax=Streptomyces tuirus TaxID=68278 RepID=A0A941FAP1_9ACTN|nr:GNAT family N-acetyltransferase [Streptomyces tuirus]
MRASRHDRHPAPAQDGAIEGSLNFGVYEKVSGEQVAYARVITDRATFGWLCDVYVDPAVRGKRAGTALVAAVRDELGSYGVRRILQHWMALVFGR